MSSQEKPELPRKSPPISTCQREDFVRLVDSLARFYNSQITVHVGYQLTLTATVVGISLALFTSIILRSEKIFPIIGTIAILPQTAYEIYDTLVRVLVIALLPVGLLVYFFSNRRYLFKYLVGRTQYYQALSEAAWAHMGLQSLPRTPETDYMLRLKERALSDEYGIQHAVISLFEARLFLSLLHRKLTAEQEEDKEILAWIGGCLKEFFDLDPNVTPFMHYPYRSPYAKRILWYSRMEELLKCAYRTQIKEMEKNKSELLDDPKKVLDEFMRAQSMLAQNH